MNIQLKVYFSFFETNKSYIYNYKYGIININTKFKFLTQRNQN
jgi:hypothetical protein